MLTGWSVYIRNASYERVAQLDDLTSLECIERHLGLGTWVLEVPFDGHAVDLLTRTNGVGIELRDAVGRIMFAGPARTIRRQRTADTDTLTVTGWDDMAALHARVVHPAPLAAVQALGTYSTAYDTRTGPASTVLRGFVDINAGPSARAPRPWPGLTLAADPAEGPTITVSGRFQNLLEHVASVAAPNGMSVLIRQADGGLVCTVRASRDRTNVELSPRAGTLQGWTMMVAAPDMTAGFAGGQGELVDRLFATKAWDAPPGWPLRIERFVDYRNAENGLELTRKLYEAEAEHGLKTSLELTPSEGLASQYGVDFDLGDNVTVVLDQVRSVETVTTATYRIRDGESSRTFNVGPEQPQGPAALFKQLRRLGTQIRNLEGT